MQIIKEKTVAFTGHRTQKLIVVTEMENPTVPICNKTLEVITELYLQGYDTFISGMAVGFDTLAVLAVLELRQKYPDVKLIAAIPFVGQDKSWNFAEKFTYKHQLKQADHIEIVCEQPSKTAFIKRNDFMLENCSQVVCFYADFPGGTKYTVNKALKMGLPITNIAELLW